MYTKGKRREAGTPGQEDDASTAQARTGWDISKQYKKCGSTEAQKNHFTEGHLFFVQVLP